ncbi:putative centlein [Triplophysa rosa]|uniref:Centlein n=1 Tax=Triplophysa rosa TaxID=992332 RepID=A0A9W7WZH3_TRIRA|nr:putative centlein [Triplophysa rosa]
MSSHWMLRSCPLSPKCEMCFQEAGHKQGNPSLPHLHAHEEQLSVDTRTTRDLKTQQGSTSSSPSGRSSADGTARQEQKIQRLQDLLALKIKENEDLRRAHAKHHDRLRVIQTNYRTVTKQLKEAEDMHDLLRGKTRLQQDSDELWNELVLCKEENKKLLVDNVCCYGAAVGRTRIFKCFSQSEALLHILPVQGDKESKWTYSPYLCGERCTMSLIMKAQKP